MLEPGDSGSDIPTTINSAPLYTQRKSLSDFPTSDAESRVFLKQIKSCFPTRSFVIGLQGYARVLKIVSPSSAEMSIPVLWTKGLPRRSRKAALSIFPLRPAFLNDGLNRQVSVQISIDVCLNRRYQKNHFRREKCYPDVAVVYVALLTQLHRCHP